MATKPQAAAIPKQDKTVEQKVQQLRELFSAAPEVGRTALENVLRDLTSQASKPRTRMESAGRIAAARARSRS